MKICPWHKKLFVNQNETEQVCSLCWNQSKYHSITKLIFPPDVSQYLRSNGQVVESLLPHRKSCPALAGGNPLKIIYPQDKASLYVPRDFDGKLQKVNLRAGHQQKNCTIYWYLDDQLKGTTYENHELPVELRKGWHNLEVIDESGYNSLVRFYANLRE
jgi:penicillin-binding protein 1C